jgi:subtilisin family serine protease
MTPMEPQRYLPGTRRVSAAPRLWPSLLCLLILFGSAQAGLGQDAPARPYVPGEILVKFKSNVPAERLRRWQAGLGMPRPEQVDPGRLHRLTLPPSLSVDAAIDLYRRNPDVEYAEPNYVRKALAAPVDPALNLQWALHNTDQNLVGTDPLVGRNGITMKTGDDIDAENAWDVTTGDIPAPVRLLAGGSTGLSAPSGVSVDTVNNEIGVANPAANSVTIYSRTANGNVKPLRSLSGPTTGLSGPTSIYVDTVNNEIGVTNSGNNSVTIYSRTANGDVAPRRTVQGPTTDLSVPDGIYVDTFHNEIGVANRGNNSVTIYSRTAVGDVAPLRTLTGPTTGLSNPFGIYVDTVNNEIGVANNGNNSVTIYTLTADGDMAPLRTLSGPTTGLSSPSGIFVDTGVAVYGEIGVVNRANNSVTTYPLTADGDATPLLTLTGPSTGLSGPVGVYADTIHNEIGVANVTSDSVTTYENLGAGPETLIAVIDSGVDYTHPDLSGNIWTNPQEDPWTDPQHQNPARGNGLDDDLDGYIDDWKGWNFVEKQCALDSQGQCNCPVILPTDEGNNNPMDDFGHGTAVAGIAAAIGNNGEGIAGVMWRAKLMPLKVLDSVGCGNVGREVSAINYAILKGAKIILLSSGSSGYSQSESDAIQAAGRAGILVVTAAGNDGSDNDQTPVYPSSYGLRNLISAAASDYNDNLASAGDSNDNLALFSNYGRNSVDIAAPGKCIFTTMPTGSFTLQNATYLNLTCTKVNFSQNYDYITGTSFAAAHVAGVAGLLLSLNAGLSPEQLKAVIMSTAEPRQSLATRVVAGGRLDANRAVSRKTASTVNGGSGGDAGCLGPALRLGAPKGGGGPPSAGTAAATVLSFALPLVLASRRIRALLRLRRTRMGLTTFLMCALLLHLFASAGYSKEAETTPEERAAAEKIFPHQLSLKLGLHKYPDSNYFDSNSTYFNANDLSSLAVELAYDYRWLYPKYPSTSVGLAVGYYDGQTSYRSICCSNLTFSTFYTLITLKYKQTPAFLAPLYWYAGVGVGEYFFWRDVTEAGVSSHFSEQVFGTHYLLGVGWPLTNRLGFFTEARYAIAKISSTNGLNDSLGIGGLTAFIGMSWEFPTFAEFLPTRPPSAAPAAAPQNTAAPTRQSY